MAEGKNTGKEISREELDAFIETILETVKNGGTVKVEGFSIRNPLIKQIVALEELQGEGLVLVTTELEFNCVVTVKE